MGCVHPFAVFSLSKNCSLVYQDTGCFGMGVYVKAVRLLHLAGRFGIKKVSHSKITFKERRTKCATERSNWPSLRQ
jgi:hypothetical protein